MKRKTKTLDSFQEEIKENKWEQKKRADQIEQEKNSYFYLDCSNISDECYEWWLVVLKYHDYKPHDRLPIWMKELFIPW